MEIIEWLSSSIGFGFLKSVRESARDNCKGWYWNLIPKSWNQDIEGKTWIIVSKVEGSWRHIARMGWHNQEVKKKHYNDLVMLPMMIGWKQWQKKRHCIIIKKEAKWEQWRRF
jgi:hypothetical protein